MVKLFILVWFYVFSPQGEAQYEYSKTMTQQECSAAGEALTAHSEALLKDNKIVTYYGACVPVETDVKGSI